jgi:hypothetical protein
MAFLLPLILLKAIGLGPKALLSPRELESFCDEVDAVETAGLQQEINASLQTLTRVHSILVLLQAAMISPNDHETRKVPDEDAHGNVMSRETKFGNIVAAYSNYEVGADGRSGWIFDKAIKAIETVEANNSWQLGKSLPNKTIQKVQFPTTNASAPLLELFLEKFQAHALTAGFGPTKCLETCREAVNNAGLNPKASQYTAKACNLLDSLWGLNMEKDLAEVSNWVGEIQNSPTTEDWLRDRLQLNALATQINQLYTTGDDEAKLALSKIAALLDTNSETFFLIHGRFLDPNGLEVAIKHFNAQTTPSQEQLQEWENLLAATYGAIAHRIFRQASLAVRQAQTILN